MGASAIHSLNSCLLLRPYRSEGAPCADWLCANVENDRLAGLLAHAVLSALPSEDFSNIHSILDPDRILGDATELHLSCGNCININIGIHFAPQSYQLQYPHFWKPPLVVIEHCQEAWSLSRSLPASSTSLMRLFTSGKSCMSHPADRCFNKCVSLSHTIPESMSRHVETTLVEHKRTHKTYHVCHTLTHATPAKALPVLPATSIWTGIQPPKHCSSKLQRCFTRRPRYALTEISCEAGGPYPCRAGWTCH